MAITKIHPIKTTLDLSIEYICNPNKTDGEILISTHACGHETASLEFKMTRHSWNSSSKNLARHLIQSFNPEDNLTPEMAHEIGEKLIYQTLKGKYEYVLTTHVDKGHIHNHIVFNNVSYIDGHAYNSNKKTYHQIRGISDRLCKEYGLSIIEKPGAEKGKSYKEYQERKKGKSWKAQLQYAIDKAIKTAYDWEEFLKIMESMGYEIKEGKHISFRAKDQERFTRARIIGEDYTEESIKKRIESRVSSKSKLASKPKSYTSINPDKTNIEKIIDIRNNTKAKEFKGYEIWAKQHNLKNMAKTLNLMSVHRINSKKELYDVLDRENIVLTNIASDIKSIENKIETFNLTIKNIESYNKLQSIYSKYINSKDRDRFYKANTENLILFEASEKFLESINLENPDLLTLMKRDLKNEIDKKNKIHKSYQKQKEKVYQLNFLKSNLETYMEWQEPSINKNMEH